MVHSSDRAHISNDEMLNVHKERIRAWKAEYHPELGGGMASQPAFRPVTVMVGSRAKDIQVILAKRICGQGRGDV